jgi:hypothetical protein
MKRVAAICIAGLAAACGSDGGDRSSWAEEANAACRQAIEEAESIPEPGSVEEAVTVLQRYNEVGRRLDAKLRRLRPAPDERERARRMVDAYAAVLPIQEGMADALRQGDQPTFQMLRNRMEELGARGDRLALDLGAEDCAREAFDEEADADVD